MERSTRRQAIGAKRNPGVWNISDTGLGVQSAADVRELNGSGKRARENPLLKKGNIIDRFGVVR
jgi:hypothetical protein